jgi:hypothetical protein
MTSVMAHFHRKPEVSLTHDIKGHCDVLSIEGEGTTIDIFLYGEVVLDLVEAVERHVAETSEK